MNPTIHVGLARPYVGGDLADYLAEHGLAATVVTTDDECELEVRDAVEPEERLRRTFEDALRDWLAARELPLIPVSSSEHDYVLRPPGD